MSKVSGSKKVQSQPGTPRMDVTGALAAIDQVIALLALTPKTITAKQRKAATRSRKGMEKVIPALSLLSDEHGVSVPKQPTSAMTSNLELVSQLEPVQLKLTSLATLMADTIDGARSGSWNTATTLYGMLQKAAHRDPQIRSQLAPIQEFFAYRHPSVRAELTKQKAKKAALKAEKEAAAQAAADSSAQGTHSTSPATASTNANAAPATGAEAAPSAVVTPHVA